LGKLSDEDELKVTEALVSVKAQELASRFIDQLSDGERQKVVLARALAQNPSLMLLDEPTAHLDFKHRVEVMGILRSLCRDKNLTVFASVHDVDVAAKVSDLVLTLKDGTLASFGPPEATLNSQTVSTLYDFDQAGFSSLLGGVEIRGDGGAGQAFVISDKDSGAQTFRYLAKKGYALSCGILDSRDLDAYVARALGARLFLLDRAETDADKDKLFNDALEAMETATLVVDSRVAMGASSPRADAPANGNGLSPRESLSQRLLSSAREKGMKVVTFGGDHDPLAAKLNPTP
jgi:iron complex transport system ATP-binding protein